MPYPYNPYPYPSQPGYGFQQYQQQNTYAFVNGIEGAKSYIVQPNQTVMLMDSDAPMAYMKQANAMGQSTIRRFRLVEVTEPDVRDRPEADLYVTKEEFQAFKDSLSKKEGE